VGHQVAIVHRRAWRYVVDRWRRGQAVGLVLAARRTRNRRVLSQVENPRLPALRASVVIEIRAIGAQSGPRPRGAARHVSLEPARVPLAKHAPVDFPVFAFEQDFARAPLTAEAPRMVSRAAVHLRARAFDGTTAFPCRAQRFVRLMIVVRAEWPTVENVKRRVGERFLASVAVEAVAMVSPSQLSISARHSLLLDRQITALTAR